MASSRSHNRSGTDYDGSNYASSAYDDEVPQPFLGGKSDFNADFSSHFSSNNANRRSGGKMKAEDQRPILGADEPVKRPTATGARSKTTGTFASGTATGSSATANRKTNFFGLKSSISDVSAAADYGAEEKNSNNIMESYKTTPITIGRRKIAVWPYDDYHLVQKVYYEKLQESALEAQQQQSGKKRSPNKKDIAAQQLQQAAQQAAAVQRQQDQSIPIFSRPPDPPDIPTAVKGLSLTAFEEKSEERAISIVSTWLFDAELIDELLANGGMTAKMMINGGTSENANKHNERLMLSRSGDQYSQDGNASIGDESQRSNKTTSEGVEVGAHGFPIEGSTKMDKEIAKLRNSTKRQLALINARLNDGVTATGGEVQELVDAVSATKNDIGHLRELSTYITNNSDVEKTSRFMLTKYPKLKQAINARRNISRVFRELDFFSSIPGTCDRLREELHAGEWTTNEWSSLRSVSREHCDLEIFLVEAEAEMKKRLQQELSELSRNNEAASFSDKAKKQVLIIDRFLEGHVSNVWELGEEIRLRIMSGISSTFELAMNNPAGLVALVEAVEVYEFANEEYMAVYGERAGNANNAKLQFTDMRAAAITELYKDFETRCSEVFKELALLATDVMTAEEDPSSGNTEEAMLNKQFNAVIRAAHDLSLEIATVKDRMAPCFPPNWHVDALWTTCVAHVCSNNILKEIGGPEGHKLTDLNVTQMLDLVAWVENFRESIMEIFPNLEKLSEQASYMSSSKAVQRLYYNQPLKLLGDNSKTIDMQLAEDSLIWVNNTLWSVHDLAKDEFLYRTQEQTETWLTNVYSDEHNKAQTSEGRLVTSLCEDIYSLASVQIRTIRERLTRRSEALVQAVGVVFKHLFDKQTSCRDNFCTDFETCCAAANDFLRMSDKCEEIVEEIKRECKLSTSSAEILDEQTAALLTLYSSDAVYSAQKTHQYCFQPIEEAIANELFSPEWEDELTHNELALTLVRTLDDFMEDLETFLDELMVTQAVKAQISSSVNFYLRCLLKKSSSHKSNKKSAFSSNEIAIRRMRGDSQVMREYFDGLAESMPTLARIVEHEFSFLEGIFELISIAAGVSKSDAQDFILILQKRVKNIHITKLVVGDIWHLVNPCDERAIYELIDTMEDTLNAVAPIDEKAIAAAQDRNTVPGLRMDEMMAKHVEQDERKRPMHSDAIQKAEGALRGWGWLRKKGDLLQPSQDDLVLARPQAHVTTTQQPRQTTSLTQADDDSEHNLAEF